MVSIIEPMPNNKFWQLRNQLRIPDTDDYNMPPQ